MKLILAIMTALMLSGCGTVNVESYKDNTPKLVIEDYLAGPTKASGVIQDRLGKVRKRFDVDLNGTWDAQKQTLTMTEDFVYDDNTKEHRVWTIVKTGPDKYEGTATNSVVGKAKGGSAGNAFLFQYAFDVPMGKKKLRTSFDDWMYLQPDGKTLVNHAVIYKFGIRIADTYIFFRKE